MNKFDVESSIKSYTSIPWASWSFALLFGVTFLITMNVFIFAKDRKGNRFVNEVEISWWMIMLTIF